MRKILLSLLLAASFCASAETPATQPLPDADLPQTGPAGEEMIPEVRIIKKRDARIEEYRLNGLLYMVKIVPAMGPPYYLIDSDGDGKLESRYNRLDPGIMVPQWMIHRW